MATRSTVPFTMEQLLLMGYPGELLDDEVEKVRAAAQWYVSDANHPESARARVLDVWIEGIYRPAWDARPIK
jgi:hypothetical protein